MTKRIIGEAGSPQRRRFLFLPLLLAATVALFSITGASAVHDTAAFQLDGNAQTTDLGTPPSTGADDWDRVCHQVIGSDCGTASNTTGATAVSFTNDGVQNASIFTGEFSGDPQDIDQWAWKDGRPAGQGQPAGQLRRPHSLPPAANCQSGANPTCELLSSAPTASITAVTPSRGSGSYRTGSPLAATASAEASASTVCTRSATC